MLKKTTCGLYDGNIIQFIVFNRFIYFIWSVYSGCLLRYLHNIATVWCVFLRLSVDGCQPQFVFSRQELFAIRRISPSLLLRKQCLSLRELFQSHREREQHLALQFVGNDVVVGIDADVAGDFQAFAGDGKRVHFGVVIEGARGR